MYYILKGVIESVGGGAQTIAVQISILGDNIFFLVKQIKNEAPKIGAMEENVCLLFRSLLPSSHYLEGLYSITYSLNMLRLFKGILSC